METIDPQALRTAIIDSPLDESFFTRARTELAGAPAELESTIEEIEMALEEKEPLRLAIFQLLTGNDYEARPVIEAGTDSVAETLKLRLLVQDGFAAKALQFGEKLAKTHDSAEVSAFLAEARATTGDLDGARKLLDTAAGASAGTKDYLEGLIEERDGEYAEALAAYERAVEAEPLEPRFAFRLGFLSSLHGDEARVIPAYEKCRETVPVHVRALINLGIEFEDSERYGDAIAAYRKILTAHPEHERAKLYLGDAEASTDMFYDREKEKERSRRNQLLQIPITDFELSVRSRNCLHKMNIHTLGDLIQKSEAELLSYKNFGETSLNEIKRILIQKGFRLGEGLDGGSGDGEESDNEQERLMSEPVSVLELSSRSQRCMDRLGIESLRELCSRNEPDLLTQKNFGVTSLNEVKRKLKERGLSLSKP